MAASRITGRADGPPDFHFHVAHPTDGRKPLVEPFPSWLGYSTGRWEGDTLVVDTNGFSDKSWLDARGHPHSESMQVNERIHRRDFGHLEVELTVVDSVMLTKPVTVKFTEMLLPASDIMEYFCQEGERDRKAPN